jgi:NAD+ diphosphatase
MIVRRAGAGAFYQGRGKTMPNTLWFMFHNSSLLLRRTRHGASALPRGEAPPLPPAGALHRLGLFRRRPCTAYDVTQTPDPQEWDAPDLRAAYGLIEGDLHCFANKGFELIHWDRQSQYCSACGSPMKRSTAASKTCPSCGRKSFPALTPAVLTLVRKQDGILLARARSFKEPYYSILAGYLEPGESLEECARREVFEETGITVGALAYFGSQSWPFPSTLMVGFIAEYESGELRIQKKELASGAFFTRDDLPRLPDRFTLSRRMIDWWLKQG